MDVETQTKTETTKIVRKNPWARMRCVWRWQPNRKRQQYPTIIIISGNTRKYGKLNRTRVKRETLYSNDNVVVVVVFVGIVVMKRKIAFVSTPRFVVLHAIVTLRMCIGLTIGHIQANTSQHRHMQYSTYYLLVVEVDRSNDNSKCIFTLIRTACHFIRVDRKP